MFVNAPKPEENDVAETDFAALGQRIGWAANRIGDRKTAASHMGISADQLQRYIRGANEPKIGAMMRLAAHAQVSLDWLVSGNGQPTGNPDALPKRLVWNVVYFLAERSELITAAPQELADAVVALSAYLADESGENGDISAETMAKIIDFAAAQLQFRHR